MVYFIFVPSPQGSICSTELTGWNEGAPPTYMRTAKDVIARAYSTKKTKLDQSTADCLRPFFRGKFILGKFIS